MKIFKFLFLGFVLSSSVRWAAAEELPLLPKGPLLLTSVKTDQLRADYWIARMSDPDKVLIAPAGRDKFNKEIRAIIRDNVDIFEMEAKFHGPTIRDQIKLEYKTVKGRKLFDVAGKHVRQSIFEEQIKPQLHWEDIPKRITLKWAAARRSTAVRALPTGMKMIEAPDDIEFDQLQFTHIKLWTPVAIYHTTRDGRWHYIQAPYVRGWVESKDIVVFPDRWALEKYAQAHEFLMVTGESVLIYNEPSLETVQQRASTGTRLVFAGETAAFYEVWIPRHKKFKRDTFLQKSFVAKPADVSNGFLSYTKRNVINQAFKLLGARYGWGGAYAGRDCSGFVHDVFLPFGIDMPRDSSQMGFIGTQINNFELGADPNAIVYYLRQAEPGITLLRMPMHMMLYLGEVDGRFYVIHSTWAERISMTSDEKNRINQVVVSDLQLNGNSYLGPLLNNIISINEVQ